MMMWFRSQHVLVTLCTQAKQLISSYAHVTLFLNTALHSDICDDNFDKRTGTCQRPKNCSLVHSSTNGGILYIEDHIRRRTIVVWEAVLSQRRSGKVAAKAYITFAIRLRYDYDTTIPRRIRLRRKWSKLRFAFDSTAIRLRQDYDEKLTCSFFVRVEWRRMEAGARDTSWMIGS